MKRWQEAARRGKREVAVEKVGKRHVVASQEVVGSSLGAMGDVVKLFSRCGTS